MTLVYVPTLIESVEQAEKLPVGTIARHAAGSGMDHAHKIVVPAIGLNRWVSLAGTQPNSTMVGWTALVPVEAEEERRLVSEDPVGAETYYNADAVNHPVLGDYLARLPAQTRYVTTWTDAP